MKNLITRSLTGLIFVLVLGACTLYNEYSFLALFTLIAFFTLFEFYRILRSKNVSVFPFVGLVGAILVLGLNIAFLCKVFDLKYLSLVLLVIPTIMINGLYSNRKEPIRATSWTMLGIFYIIIPFCLFMHIGFLKDFEYNGWRILAMFLILWSTDTLAYVFGSLLGKHKMFPRISPKKSWEGAVGGALGGMLVAYLVSTYFPDTGIGNWYIVAALIVVFGIFGDLVESLFKRKFDLKDSGQILPGHGGFLDRFDSLIGFAPFVYVYLFLIL